MRTNSVALNQNSDSDLYHVHCRRLVRSLYRKRVDDSPSPASQLRSERAGGPGNGRRESLTRSVLGNALAVTGQHIESGRIRVAAKICRGLREVDDGDQRGLCKLRIGDALYVFLRLRGNTLAHPEFTSKSRVIEGEGYPFPSSACCTVSGTALSVNGPTLSTLPVSPRRAQRPRG